jgi:DNA-binding CsgD family transcriptional regulator
MGERGRPKYPDVLTPRQFEVLELIREGLTNPQIAERLGISPDGAKWHVKEILWKLDAPSREEAARRDVGRGKPTETVPLARLRFGDGGWHLRRSPSGRCRSRCAGSGAMLEGARR